MRSLAVFLVFVFTSNVAGAQEAPPCVHTPEVPRDEPSPPARTRFLRDEQGHRILCATFEDSSTECHPRRVQTRAATVLTSISGATLLVGGFTLTTLGAFANNPLCFSLDWDGSGSSDDSCPTSTGDGRGFHVASVVAYAGGAALLTLGIVRGSQRRQAGRFLRDHHVSVMPVVTRSGDAGAALALTF